MEFWEKAKLCDLLQKSVLIGLWGSGRKQNCSRKGGLTHRDGTSSDLIIGLLPSRPSQGSAGPPERGRICPSPWASPLSQAARGCWCSLPSIQREWHNTLRDSIAMGQIILFLSAPTQWQSPEGHTPNSLPTRNLTITLQWTKEMSGYREGLKRYSVPGQQETLL